jgi:hypothetical protein
MPLRQGLARLARRPERVEKLALERPQSAKRIVVEIGHIDDVLALRCEPNDVPKPFDESGIAISGQGHLLAFV